MSTSISIHQHSLRPSSRSATTRGATGSFRLCLCCLITRCLCGDMGQSLLWGQQKGGGAGGGITCQGEVSRWVGESSWLQRHGWLVAIHLFFSMIHPDLKGRWSHFDDIIFFKGVGSTINFCMFEDVFQDTWGISKVKSNSIFDVWPGLPCFMCGSSGDKGLMTYVKIWLNIQCKEAKGGECSNQSFGEMIRIYALCQPHLTRILMACLSWCFSFAMVHHHEITWPMKNKLVV